MPQSLRGGQALRRVPSEKGKDEVFGCRRDVCPGLRVEGWPGRLAALDLLKALAHRAPPPLLPALSDVSCAAVAADGVRNAAADADDLLAWLEWCRAEARRVA